MKRIAIVVVMFVCLFATATISAEEITVHIRDHEGNLRQWSGETLTMDEGHFCLWFSGGKEGSPYHVSLTFNNKENEQRTKQMEFAGAEEACMNLPIIGQSGEHVPFALTITNGAETTAYAFDAIVPDGDIESYFNWALYDHAERKLIPFYEVMYGNPDAPSMQTSMLSLLSPADGTVCAGQNGDALPYRVVCKKVFKGGYTHEIINLLTHEVVYKCKQVYSKRPEGTVFDFTKIIQYQTNTPYMVRLTHENEVAFTRFYLVDENTWDGTNPWTTLGDEYADIVEDYAHRTNAS